MLTSLETSKVGRHKMIISIKIFGIITAAFIVSYQSPGEEVLYQDVED